MKWEQNAQVEDKGAKISDVRMGSAAITGDGQDNPAYRDLEYMIYLIWFFSNDSIASYSS